MVIVDKGTLAGMLPVVNCRVGPKENVKPDCIWWAKLYVVLALMPAMMKFTLFPLTQGCMGVANPLVSDVPARAKKTRILLPDAHVAL